METGFLIHCSLSREWSSDVLFDALLWRHWSGFGCSSASATSGPQTCRPLFCLVALHGDVIFVLISGAYRPRFISMRAAETWFDGGFYWSGLLSTFTTFIWCILMLIWALSKTILGSIFSLKVLFQKLLYIVVYQGTAVVIFSGKKISWPQHTYTAQNKKKNNVT